MGDWERPLPVRHFSDWDLKGTAVFGVGCAKITAVKSKQGRFGGTPAYYLYVIHQYIVNVILNVNNQITISTS
jgi:hypothetical protein